MLNKIIISLLLLICITILPALTVYDIQYTEDPGGASPYEGEEVTVTGIVTAVGFSGDKYFISDAEGGPWSGIYVFDYSNSPSLGDEIEITAEVEEYYGFTELSYVSSYELLSSYNDIPEPVELTTNEVNQEMYESVFVKVNDVEVVGTMNDYNEWEVDDGSGECQIDDNFDNFNPNNVDTSLGTVYRSIQGLVDFSFDTYAINPRQTSDLQELSDFYVEYSTLYPALGENIDVITEVQDSASCHILWKTDSETDFNIVDMELTSETPFYTFEGSIPSQSQGTLVLSVVYADLGDTIKIYPENTGLDSLSNFTEIIYPVEETKAVLEIEPKVYRHNGEEIPIKYGSKRTDKAIIRIYSSEGRLVNTIRNLIIDTSSGVSTFYWDGRDKDYKHVPIGMCICHLEVTDVETGKTKTKTAPIVIGTKLK